MAAKEGCHDCVRALVQSCANREITDHLDRQPCDIAKEKMHQDIYKLLTEYQNDGMPGYAQPNMYTYQQHASIHRTGAVPCTHPMNSKSAKKRQRKNPPKKKSQSSLNQPSTVAIPKERGSKKRMVECGAINDTKYGTRGVDLPPSYDQACSSRVLDIYNNDMSEQIYDPNWSSPTSCDQTPINHMLLSESSIHGLVSCVGFGSPLSSMTNSPPSGSDVLSSPLTSIYSPCGATNAMSPPCGTISYNSPTGVQTMSPPSNTFQPPNTHLQAMHQNDTQQPYMQQVYSSPKENSPVSATPLLHIIKSEYELPPQCVPEPSYPTPPSHSGRQVVMAHSLHQHHSSFPTPSPESAGSVGELPGEWSSDPQSSPPNWRDNTILHPSQTNNGNARQLGAYY